MTGNTFHGDPRPSSWRRRAQAGRPASHRETGLIAPPGNENERVSCCCQTFGFKAKKHGASRDVVRKLELK